MGRIGIPEILFIGLIIILLFGVKKLPEIGQALGKALREFRNAGGEQNNAKVTSDTSDENKS